MYKHKRKLIVISLVVAGLALFTMTQIAFVAPLFAGGETESFRYTIQAQRNGSLYVNVSANFDDPLALKKYKEANNRRGRDLVSKSQSPIPVRVTFARPIPLDEARQLVRETGLRVDSFAMAGRTLLTGQKGTHVEVGSLDADVDTIQKIDPTGKGDNLSLIGVIVIYGELQGAQGLARLLEDERVYLADTTEVELRRVLAQRHASIVAGKELVFAIPSPFWKLDW